MDYILFLILCLLFVYGRHDVIVRPKINLIVAPRRIRVQIKRPNRNFHTQTKSVFDLSKDALPFSTSSNVSDVTLVTSDIFTIVEPTALKNEDNHVQTSTVHSLESKKEVVLSDRDATIKTDEAMSIADDDALPSTSTSTSNVSNMTQMTSDGVTIVEPTTLTNEVTHVQCSSLHPLESKKEEMLSDCNAKNETDEALSIADETLMPLQSISNTKTQQSTQVNAALSMKQSFKNELTYKPSEELKAAMRLIGSNSTRKLIFPEIHAKCVARAQKEKGIFYQINSNPNTTRSTTQEGPAAAPAPPPSLPISNSVPASVKFSETFQRFRHLRRAVPPKNCDFFQNPIENPAGVQELNQKQASNSFASPLEPLPSKPCFFQDELYFNSFHDTCPSVQPFNQKQAPNSFSSTLEPLPAKPCFSQDKLDSNNFHDICRPVIPKMSNWRLREMNPHPMPLNQQNQALTSINTYESISTNGDLQSSFFQLFQMIIHEQENNKTTIEPQFPIKFLLANGF